MSSKQAAVATLHLGPSASTAALFALLAALALLPAAVEAQVRVVAPKQLAQELQGGLGFIYGSTATFGAPYYGERVLGRLLYGESLHGKAHCTPDDDALSPPPGAGAMPGVPQGTELVDVVIVRRGQCTFVTKVRIAEGKGAHAVIVVDKESSTKTSEEIQHVVVPDDGWGDSIKIPSVLVSRDEGQRLIDAAREGTVVVELAWDIPHAEVVLADFWMSSGSRESLNFLKRFKSSAETLRYHLQFEPHYHIFSLPGGTSHGHLCADRRERHCAPDPDGPGPITGADVANEDLRQLCIWRTTRSADKRIVDGATYSQLFWEYVVRLGSDCPLDGATADNRFGDKCSRRTMKKVGIDEDEIYRCEVENVDKYLDEQIKNVAWSPQALRLNGWRYSGPLDPEAVLKAICSGYAAPPQECEDLLSGYSGVVTFVAGALTPKLLAWTVLVLVVLMAFVLIFYRRHMTKSVKKVLREEVMLEVQAQMAEYAPMPDLDLAAERVPLSF